MLHWRPPLASPSTPLYCHSGAPWALSKMDEPATLWLYLWQNEACPVSMDDSMKPTACFMASRCPKTDSGTPADARVCVADPSEVLSWFAGPRAISFWFPHSHTKWLVGWVRIVLKEPNCLTLLRGWFVKWHLLKKKKEPVGRNVWNKMHSSTILNLS